MLALQRDNPGKARMELALLQAQTESRATVRFCTRRKCRILRDEVAWVKKRTLPYGKPENRREDTIQSVGHRCVIMKAINLVRNNSTGPRGVIAYLAGPWYQIILDARVIVNPNGHEHSGYCDYYVN